MYVLGNVLKRQSVYAAKEMFCIKAQKNYESAKKKTNVINRDIKNRM